MRRTITFVVVIAAALVAVRIVKARTAAITLATPQAKTQRWSAPDPIALYDADCAPGQSSPYCAALRGAVTYRLVWALDGMSTRLPESADSAIALDALGVPEPEVREAALRLLARAGKPTTGEAKLLELLLTERWSLQKRASEVLRQSSNPAMNRVAAQWEMNHANGAGVVARPDAPELYWATAPMPSPAAVGFPAYAGASPFSPGESDRSLAFYTKDPVDKVLAFYAKSQPTKPLDAPTWAQWIASHQGVYYPQPDAKAMEKHMKLVEEMGKKMADLAARYAKHQDPKLMQEMEAIAKQADAANQAFEASLPKIEDRPGVIAITMPPNGISDATIFVQEAKNKRASRVLVIYKEDAVGGTVIQMVWDPTLVAAKP